MRNAALVLVLVVAASGCIHTSTPDTDSSPDTAQEQQKKLFADCSDIQLKIDSASSNSAMIRQMNNQSIGKVTAEWSYRNEEKFSKTVNLSDRGDLKLLSSDKSGEMEQFTVEPERCPEQIETLSP